MANKNAVIAAMSSKSTQVNKKAEQEIGSPKKGYDIRSNTDKVSGYVNTKEGKKKIYEETVGQQMAGGAKNTKRYIIDENTGKKTYLQD